MPLVVADSGITLPGLIDRGLYRKLMTVFLYGRLIARVGEAHDEYDQARELADEHSGEVGPRYEQAIEEAKDRATGAREIMPADCPDDLALVTSRPLLDEVANVLTGPRLPWGQAVAHQAPAYRALALAFALRVVPEDAFAQDIPPYTEGRDVDDDPVVHTALEGRAEVIVSKDKHLVPNYKVAQHYAHPSSGASTDAMKTNLFIKTYVERDGFKIDDLEGSELDALMRLVQIKLPI